MNRSERQRFITLAHVRAITDMLEFREKPEAITRFAKLHAKRNEATDVENDLNENPPHSVVVRALRCAAAIDFSQREDQRKLALVDFVILLNCRGSRECRAQSSST